MLLRAHSNADSGACHAVESSQFASLVHQPTSQTLWDIGRMVGWRFFSHADWPRLCSGSMFQSCMSVGGIDWLNPVGCAESLCRQSPTVPHENFWSNSFWALCQINLRTKMMKNLRLPVGCWLPVRRALKSAAARICNVTCFSNK